MEKEKGYKIGKTKKDFIKQLKIEKKQDSIWLFGCFKDKIEKNNNFELKYWSFKKNKKPEHDSKFQKKSTEYTFIIKGKVKGNVDGKKVELKTGDYIIIKPKTKSNLIEEVLEDTIGITIKSPSLKGDTQR